GKLATLLQTSIEVSHGIEDTQARAYCSVSVIFVCHRIAKIDQEPVPQELGNIPIVALDDFRTRRLIGTDDLPILFGVELGGELRGVHEVTKHHGQLAAFGFWGARYWWRCVRKLRCLDGKLLWGLGRWRGDCVCAFSITEPDQDALILLHCQFLRVDQLVLQVCQCLVVESDLPFQKAVGQPFPLSEQIDNLVEDVVQAHSRLLSSSSSSAFASIRSAVSKPSVNQL